MRAIAGSAKKDQPGHVLPVTVLEAREASAPREARPVPVAAVNRSRCGPTIGTADQRDHVVRRMPFGELILARVGGEGWKKTPCAVEELAAAEIDELVKERASELRWIFVRTGELEAQARLRCCRVVAQRGRGR